MTPFLTFKSTALCLMATTALLLPQVAFADNYNTIKPSITGYDTQKDDWSITLGAGALAAPEYEGSDDYEVMALPYFDVKYKDIVTLNPFDGLRFNAYRGEHYTLGAGIGVDFGRDDSDGDRIRGMGDIDATAEGVLFAKYSRNKFSSELSIAQDLGDGHDGFTIEADAGYMVPLSQKTFLRPSLSTTYASDNYMDSYFGVTNAQSARSGLNAFNAEAGFKDVSANVFAVHRLDQNWAINGLVSYSALLGDAADSPVVENENQLMGGAFVTYNF